MLCAGKRLYISLSLNGSELWFLYIIIIRIQIWLLLPIAVESFKY